MNQSIRPAEMTALFAALLTAQWFSSTASGFVDACGNAVFFAVLLAGLALLMLILVSHAITPQRGLLTVCMQKKSFSIFPIIAAILFTLLSATALRDTLSMLKLSLLPLTSRWFALILVLPVALAMGMLGISSVSRTIKLLAPLLIVLYLIVLILSVWNQFNVYNFFPLLGGGPAAIGKTAFSALSVIAWLPMLWIDRPQLGRKKCGVKACIWATVLGVAGYLFYALLFPNGSTTNASFPLHRLSVSGGLSYAFQRAQGLFVFVWLPVQLAAIGAGLCYAVRCLASVFPVRRPRLLVPVVLLIVALLGAPDVDSSPAWLLVLMQTNTQSVLLLPLLIPLLFGKIQEKKLAKEAGHNA